MCFVYLCLLYAFSFPFCAVVFAPTSLQSTTRRRGKAAVYVVEDACRTAVLLLHSIVYWQKIYTMKEKRKASLSFSRGFFLLEVEPHMQITTIHVRVL